MTTHLILAALLNNIVQGRSYDKFETLTLQNYLDLDKASKARPFQNNTSLSKITEGLNNKIRNASHHRRMEFDPNTGTVMYRSSKSGEYEIISYGDYLAAARAAGVPGVDPARGCRVAKQINYLYKCGICTHYGFSLVGYGMLPDSLRLVCFHQPAPVDGTAVSTIGPQWVALVPEGQRQDT